MGELQTLEQFREWLRNQCRKDVDPQFGESVVNDFERLVWKQREAEIWDDLVESCKEIIGYDGDLATKMATEAILDQMRHIKPKELET